MSLGQKLLELRKTKGLSQEEVAERLNVTRQTVSKWETDQSTPDFDKIVPLCSLYNITTDELLISDSFDYKKADNSYKEVIEESENFRNKRASGIGKGILLYFVAVAWIMISVPVLMINPILASAIFLLICGVATYLIVYTCIVYKKQKTKKEAKEEQIVKQINDILAIFATIIYLVVSFITMAWHITWVIWIVYGLVTEIIKLIFMLGGNDGEK